MKCPYFYHKLLYILCLNWPVKIGLRFDITKMYCSLFSAGPADTCSMVLSSNKTTIPDVHALYLQDSSFVDHGTWKFDSILVEISHLHISIQSCDAIHSELQDNSAFPQKRILVVWNERWIINWVQYRYPTAYMAWKLYVDLCIAHADSALVPLWLPGGIFVCSEIHFSFWDSYRNKDFLPNAWERITASTRVHRHTKNQIQTCRCLLAQNLLSSWSRTEHHYDSLLWLAERKKHNQTIENFLWHAVD